MAGLLAVLRQAARSRWQVHVSGLLGHTVMAMLPNSKPQGRQAERLGTLCLGGGAGRQAGQVHRVRKEEQASIPECFSVFLQVARRPGSRSTFVLRN